MLLTLRQTRILKTRKLRGEKGGDVGKFFARHIKLEVCTSYLDWHAAVLRNSQDHITYLWRTKIGAAVGTPGRLGKLLELGKSVGHPPVITIEHAKSDSMALSALTHIIIDLSYRDAKKRSVLDIPETRDEVFGKILFHKGTLQSIKAGKVKIVLF